MSRTLFIADLHLSQQEPAITAGFLHFLQHEAATADALYILGDLFEVWIGDDDPNPLHHTIATALRALPVPVWFIHGNRDFLLGHRYAAGCGMQLLPESQVIELYGHRVLIMHGDTLCTDDTGYQTFRRNVHQRWRQKLFLLLPLRLRQHIARRLRAGSQQANQQKSMAIMDVNAQAVADAFRQSKAQWLIHGHTHRPAIHSLNVDGNRVSRAVLGAWHQQGSMLQLNAEGLQLIPFVL